MTQQRTPPTKVQCIRSGKIFPKSQLDLIEDKAYDTSECPACGFARSGAYIPCRTFQNVDVDVS